MQALDRYLHSGTARLRYRDEGSGPAIVLIHGWTLDLDSWDPQSAEFSGSMRVVCLDRRGFGLSSGSPDLEADLTDLETLLDRLQIGRAVLVGMSQGARVALTFALRHPRRVSSLVLDGPPTYCADSGSGVDEDLSLDQFRELVRSAGMEAFRKTWREHPLMQLKTDDPDARRILARMLARYPGLDLLEPASRPHDAIDAATLVTVHVAVLVVNGQFDTERRRYAGDLICRALPLAERALVPDAGHLANLDNPGAYNEIIRAFLQRQPPVAA